MRLFFITCFYIIALAGQCQAQMSVAPDYFGTQNGIVATGSHSSVTAPEKMRFFVLLEPSADTPKAAVAKVGAEKSEILTAAIEAGADQDSVAFTSTKILEWQSQEGLFTNGEGALEPKINVDEFTAATLCSFDVLLEGVDSDAFSDRIHKVRELLPLDSRKVAVMYVAEVDAAQSAAAQKRAYDKAMAEAKALASLRNKPLGKLVAMKSADDRGGILGIGQVFLWRNYFPKENEVMSSDPQKLSRQYTVRLRFEMDLTE